MTSIDDFTAYLGKHVSFFLPIDHTKHPYDELYTSITGLVTAIIIDIDPRKTRFLLDDESEFCFCDCQSFLIKS